ncbi:MULTISPECIES: hypothetical protein [Mesobacillus]|uniref:Uncharacterized protein n=1 Tax=Mesobacillus stamsii TaxID=225347 RepID=A0ABU0FQ08_9BACI|nr:MULTISPECIES: hypothetical protein [Mesobacillus]MDQ0411982.1 hypothetical protein [Mesobacillus stamsii]
MKAIVTFTEMFVKDVNKENSVIVELFGRIVNVLFKIFLSAGIPYFIYLLLEFSNRF